MIDLWLMDSFLLIIQNNSVCHASSAWPACGLWVHFYLLIHFILVFYTFCRYSFTIRTFCTAYNLFISLYVAVFTFVYCLL